MRAAFRAPRACNRCSLLAGTVRGACARCERSSNSVREYHGRPHETTQPALSMRLAVSGPRLVNSGVLACLLLACRIEWGAMFRVNQGRPERGATCAR
jgi:hypothetical protein